MSRLRHDKNINSSKKPVFVLQSQSTGNLATKIRLVIVDPPAAPLCMLSVNSIRGRCVAL